MLCIVATRVERARLGAQGCGCGPAMRRSYSSQISRGHNTYSTNFGQVGQIRLTKNVPRLSLSECRNNTWMITHEPF
jgi:hypothetical protein